MNVGEIRWDRCMIAAVRMLDGELCGVFWFLQRGHGVGLGFGVVSRIWVARSERGEYILHGHGSIGGSHW